jgi:ATP-binding cassette subfamily F protein uup
MVNLVNAERLSITYGTRTILDEVSLGLGRGDVVGVVGRNGDGKTTLLQILTGMTTPDSGRVVRTGAVSIGYLHQADDFHPSTSVREVIVGGEPDHVWAAKAATRAVVEHLLADVDLDALVGQLSGGERRRVALVALMLGDHDLLVLDEPTNHLDVEAVAWLAEHLNALAERDTAMLVVSHDRWFLDAVCTRIWEVHDGIVDAYDGGYAAYVLARAERSRQAANIAGRRKNLLRKELAWLRRGAPARTSKPKFRLDAASALIADEPPPRDRFELQRFATSRLGKDVFDLHGVRATVGPPERVLLDDLTWSIGPGDRIGLVGVNGAGKTTLLRLLTGELPPTAGTVKRGKTLQLGHLSQSVTELNGSERVLESVDQMRRQTRLANGAEASASSLLEDFGFTGDKLTTRLEDLSGGERRRLQFLRLLLAEPNVLLLDEPTNDLDIDTLTVIEDYLDSWPGTLIVVTHDRYFLERVCDVTYALMGDGSCVLLPGGVEQYLQSRRDRPPASGPGRTVVTQKTESGAARQAKKDLSRIESQMTKLGTQISRIHTDMAQAAADYPRLADLQRDLSNATADLNALEQAWLAAAELVD